MSTKMELEASAERKVSAGADAALQFVAGRHIEVDEATNKAICRKIDLHLLPWMCGLYALQYLDKTTLSYAAAMGIREDTGLSAWEYAFSGSIFYIGYLVFEYPHNRLMQRFPLGKYITISVIIWGAILACTAATYNVAGVFVARFFLGALEGSVTAGFVLITASWYRLNEQAVRTAIWFSFNGFAHIVGGALAYGVARSFREQNYPFPAWKAMFVITGILTSLYGILLYIFLPDSPINASWLSEEEKVLAIERLRVNQQGIGSREFKWYQFREAFTDVRTYLIFLFMVTANIPNGGLTVFFTQLISGYGFDAETTFLLSMPSGPVQFICNIGFPYLASRYNNRMVTASFAMILGLFGISLMMGLSRSGPTDHRIGQLVGYYITIGNSATALILVLSNISSNTAGYTKKTTVNAISLIAYCVGFLIGPNTFADGPYYIRAKWNIIAMWAVSWACCLALYFVNRTENRRRDAIKDELPPQPEGQEFADLTDKENLYFRYTL